MVFDTQHAESHTVDLTSKSILTGTTRNGVKLHTILSAEKRKEPPLCRNNVRCDSTMKHMGSSQKRQRPGRTAAWSRGRRRRCGWWTDRARERRPLQGASTAAAAATGEARGRLRHVNGRSC